MWGTLHQLRDVQTQRRFIPTHVGNAAEPVGDATADAVYPHACGERASQQFADCLRIGLSPRMWGTLDEELKATRAARFIPMHVGNARQPGRCYRPPTVYPHACGERLEGAHEFHLARGLSPRMWGTLDLLLVEHQLHRFIPTHVGNALSQFTVTGNIAVYPHACGERDPQSRSLRQLRGLSPRMWGTLTKLLYSDLGCRFIPTHVGNAVTTLTCPVT